VDAIAQARRGDRLLDWPDAAIAVVVSGIRVIEHTNCEHLAAVIGADLDQRVSVFCFSSVSVVHNYFFLVCFQLWSLLAASISKAFCTLAMSSSWMGSVCMGSFVFRQQAVRTAWANVNLISVHLPFPIHRRQQLGFAIGAHFNFLMLREVNACRASVVSLGFVLGHHMPAHGAAP